MAKSYCFEVTYTARINVNQRDFRNSVPRSTYNDESALNFVYTYNATFFRKLMAHMEGFQYMNDFDYVCLSKLLEIKESICKDCGVSFEYYTSPETDNSITIYLKLFFCTKQQASSVLEIYDNLPNEFRIDYAFNNEEGEPVDTEIIFNDKIDWTLVKKNWRSFSEHAENRYENDQFNDRDKLVDLLHELERGNNIAEVREIVEERAREREAARHDAALRRARGER